MPNCKFSICHVITLVSAITRDAIHYRQDQSEQNVDFSNEVKNVTAGNWAYNMFMGLWLPGIY